MNSNALQLARVGLAIAITIALWVALSKLPVASDRSAGGKRRFLSLLMLLTVLILDVIGVYSILQ